MKHRTIWTPNGEVSIDNSTKVGQPSIGELGEIFEYIDKRKQQTPEPLFVSRVKVPGDKLEIAINFWKPRYFEYTTEGRHLNGIEAYDLGDPKKNVNPNPVPYIAMCNLMALEALRILGDQNPTIEEPDLLMFGSAREKEIAQFWKTTFAPTLFQTQWAWKAVMSVLSGSKVAFNELFVDYRAQLP